MTLIQKADSFRLPQETISHIGSFLCRSSRDLRMCSLTSRAWHSGVQSQLYQSITLDSEEKVAELETLLRDHPTVAYWIQEIRVSAFTKSTRWHANPESWTKWISRLTQILPASLCRLRSIELVGLHNPFFSGNHRLSCNHQMVKVIPDLGRFKTVKSVTFFHCELDDDVADSFICAFPDLRSLHLRKSLIMSTRDRMQLSQLRPPQLTALYVDDNHGSLKKLRLEHSFSSLQYLTVRVGGYDDCMAVADFISRLGPSLHTLELSLEPSLPFNLIEHDDGTASVSTFPVLSNLTGLHTLHISPLCHPYSIRVLSTLESREIRKLAFSITSSCIDKLRTGDIDILDRCLVPLFDTVQTVSFVYSGNLPQETVEDALFKTLPSSLCAKASIKIGNSIAE